MKKALSGFYKLPKLLQIILLLVPGVNWIVELFLRIATYLSSKDSRDLIGLILAIIPPTAIIMGWVDLVFVIISDEIAPFKKIL